MFILLLLCLGLVAAEGARADDKLSIRVRIQSRLDMGDITRSADRSTYQSEGDFYLRRARLEVVGRPADKVLYILAFSGDRWDQKGRENKATLGYALVDYRVSKKLTLQVGLTKLPYSRSALTTSSMQLLIERPQIVGLGTGLLKYIAPHLIVYGQLAGGQLAYNLALTDGFQAGEVDRALSRRLVVKSGDPGVVSRLEWAPVGWIEQRKSDAHVGRGRHLSVGLNGVFQDGLQLEGLGQERRFLLGADVSFHWESLTLGAEYMYINRDAVTQIEPSGWYIQGGYYIKRIGLEPAVRFDRTDLDANRNNMGTKIFTGGINWYLSGHEFKLQANVFHYIFDTGAREVTDEGSKTGVQLQHQMYF